MIQCLNSKKEDFSDFNKDLLQRLALSISQMIKRQRIKIENLVQIPQEGVNILINVNESFIQDNYDVRNLITVLISSHLLIQIAQKFLAIAARTEEATVYFYNYPESQLVYLQSPQNSQVESEITSIKFNPQSMIGKCVNSKEITTKESQE